MLVRHSLKCSAHPSPGSYICYRQNGSVRQIRFAWIRLGETVLPCRSVLPETYTKYTKNCSYYVAARGSRGPGRGVGHPTPKFFLSYEYIGFILYVHDDLKHDFFLYSLSHKKLKIGKWGGGLIPPPWTRPKKPCFFMKRTIRKVQSN